MINFVKYRWFAALFAFCLFASFGLVALYRYQTRGEVFKYSVDFTGGTQVLFRFEKSMSSAELVDALKQNGWLNATTREFSPTDILVRVKEYEGDAKGLGARMHQVISEKFSANPSVILQSETVGAGVGEQLRWKSVRAVVIALIAMLLYIALVFWSFAFALGAVLALFHDAIIMLATFLFFDREISISVIGAILAVLGYSINDTIVIFAQIRENLGKPGFGSLSEVVNVSINQTLRRTLLTSFATAISVIAMLVLGGEALYDFSLALMVGIVFGTYSSIYIASPVMMLFYNKKNS